MKLAIILIFGLFAVAHSDEQSEQSKQSDIDLLSQGASVFQSDIFEKVSKSSENFVKTITSPFLTAQKKTKNILLRAYTRIDQAKTKVQGSFKGITEKIEKKLKQVQEECGSEHKSEYENIKTEMIEQLEQYAEEKKSKLNHLDYYVEQQLEEIDEHIEEFRLVAVTCFHFNPVVTTECVFNKMNEYSLVIGEVGTTFNKAVAEVVKTSISAQRDVVSHSGTVVNGVIQKLNEVFKAVNSCPALE